MPKTLELVFKTADNKNARLQVPNIVATTDADYVKEAMNNLIALKILNPTTGLPVKAIAAYLIDKSTTAIFEEK
ncbi:DUF2922 domain-containing protein [Staphylococcus lugdunensis]|uniref:DUF2922 domain-containing protein n=1 Tax=Staphylococcus lugdunensis TaxID=28035 RepID=UPI000A11BA83|nr:DUF2922 domain-containing protein [Staphylococcus lugdunensis]ARJ28116.1 hypothetical protein B7469_10515 [Staphylococcus lugdunensis]MCH8672967.1 DUF2922 domain-containing protein [Staphylococcus lugdunensis]MCH8674306.1 DUF2922 domain-containing protein [Staphylococcus lugdunensis]MCI2751641.1 DUF2922 domain-containing protein [Staphylococcus lugdunensis]MCI2762152.1 DUF2922 domain-containing protein [Staphylococcus lugdunensis]